MGTQEVMWGAGLVTSGYSGGRDVASIRYSDDTCLAKVSGGMVCSTLFADSRPSSSHRPLLSSFCTRNTETEVAFHEQSAHRGPSFASFIFMDGTVASFCDAKGLRLVTKRPQGIRKNPLLVLHKYVCFVCLFTFPTTRKAHSWIARS